MRLLVVEDEPDLLEQLYCLLTDRKYDVDTATDGEMAIDKIFDNPYDLILLDVMLPKLNGFDVLRDIREARIRTPVLMLTARGEIFDKIQGLDRGADDYLAKPFSTAELLARIRALLRRFTEHGVPVLEIKGIRFNTITREVIKGGKTLKLTPKEFSILEFLLYNKNHAVSRFTLAEHVWGEDFDPFTMSNYIDVHVKNLRKKIGDHDGVVIQTIRGIGYSISD